MIPFVVGVAGGSGSGKSTLVTMLTERLVLRTVALLPQDAYYRSNPHISQQRRQHINYDHPDSLETSLMVRQVESLRRGQPIERPVYDFESHLRSGRTILVEPCDILIVEGILVLADRDLRSLMDLKIFVHASPQVRFERRLKRDVLERGRTPESIHLQHENTVRPMYDRYVEPSRSFSDIEIDADGELATAADTLAERLRRAGLGDTRPTST